MLEVVYGACSNRIVSAGLEDHLRQLEISGCLYFGYPVLSASEDKLVVDALLITDSNILIAFEYEKDPISTAAEEYWAKVQESQDALYFYIRAFLGKHPSLRQGRELGAIINVITIINPGVPIPPGKPFIAHYDDLNESFHSCKSTNPELMPALISAIQGITSLKPFKRRPTVQKTDSRGAILKEIEREIANLDKWQKKGALESPESPQRIRGLAGSGKTVVLALKAVYLHAQHRDWVIAITFHTRSLYQQFDSLVRRFSYDILGQEPDFQKLKILHSWGSPAQPGVYSYIAASLGCPVRDFVYAKNVFGMDKAFWGVCEELLPHIQSESVPQIFDAVLIDEAQDLPWPFFKLLFEATKPPKRIVWAYDELQNLTNLSMPSLRLLFGRDFELHNSDSSPQQDVILPVCYRNSPWALTLAHSLGFGIYREDGLVQHFDDPQLWAEVGYEVRRGILEPGERVSLARRQNSYPDYFEKLLDPEDAVIATVFQSPEEQANWIADSILTNLSIDELEHTDILIILPQAISAREDSKILMEALDRHEIASHLAGVTSSQDRIYMENSVAISGVFRAKGNEAPMVYIANANTCLNGVQLSKLRNTLFTAITRSQAWVRLCGVGEDMIALEAEISRLRNNGFALEFQIPGPEEIKRMRTIHRERTPEEIAKISKITRSLQELLTMIDAGDLSIDSLPSPIQEQLRRLSKSKMTEDDQS